MTSISLMRGTQPGRRPNDQGGKQFSPKQVEHILDRRALYERRYRYAGVEADGQHRAIF
jgi:hypothetical protein